MRIIAVLALPLLAGEVEALGLSGEIDTRIATAELGTTSGTIVDTLPVWEKMIYLRYDTEEWGYVDGLLWAMSLLHDQKRDEQRWFLTEIEPVVRYGYVVRFSDELRLDTCAGLLFDPLIGSRHDHNNYWGIYWKGKFDNPYLTPYWSSYWQQQPNVRSSVRTGVRRKIPLWEDFSTVPALEVFWWGSQRCYAKFGEDADHSLFGGSVSGIKGMLTLNWQYSQAIRFFVTGTEFVTIGRQYRAALRKSDSYWARPDIFYVEAGVTYSF